MKPSIGINGWVWTAPFNNDSLGLLKKAAKLGFDTIELPLEDPSFLDARKVKAALDDTGLKAVVCGAFGPTRDLTHDDPQYRQESLDYMDAAFRLCEAIGAKSFVGPMYSAVGKRRLVPAEQRKIEWDRAVSGLQKAAPMAADRGVTLCIEPLNRFETDLINTCDQAMRLVKDIGAKNVGVHLDTFHMNIEEKCIYTAIKKAGKKLTHVHACENDRGTPGTGQIDWKGLAKALKEIGYSGNVVIESFTPTCVTIAAAAAIWRPLAKKQDDIATGGVKFLKKLLK